MISVRIDRLMHGMLLVGSVTTMTACALHPQTRSATEVKPNLRTDGSWSCPGSVDGELLSRMLTAAPLRGIPR
jgi:hypothetical protein